MVLPAFKIDRESLVPARAQETFFEIMNEYPDGLEMMDLDDCYKSKKGYNIITSSWGFRSINGVVEYLQHIFRKVQCKNGNFRLFPAFLPKGEEELRLLADPYDATTEKVKNCLRELFAAVPRIYMDQLPETFFMKYQTTLDYYEYGYNSLKDFVNAQTGDIFNQSMDDGRVLLTGIPISTSTYVPEPSSINLSDVSSTHVSEDNNSDVSENTSIYVTENVATLREMDREQFPLDCLSPHDYLNNLDLRFYKPGDEIRIRITEPINGTFHQGFFFTLADAGDKIKELTEEMSIFYDKNKNNDEYRLPEWAALVDMYCVGYMDGKWHRLQILYYTRDKADCLMLDNGIADFFPKKDLYYIHNDFTQLPCQIIEGKLADFEPLEEINEQAELFFLEKTENVVTATVSQLNEHGFLEMYVDVDGVDLLSMLVENNFAKYSDCEETLENLCGDDEEVLQKSNSASEVEACVQNEQNEMTECFKPISNQPSSLVIIREELDSDNGSKIEKQQEIKVTKQNMANFSHEKEISVFERSDADFGSSTMLLDSLTPPRTSLVEKKAHAMEPSRLNKSNCNPSQTPLPSSPAGQSCQNHPQTVVTNEPALEQSRLNKSNCNPSRTPLPSSAPAGQNPSTAKTPETSMNPAPGGNINNNFSTLPLNIQCQGLPDKNLPPPGFSPLQPPGYRHPQPLGFPYLHPPGFSPLLPPGYSPLQHSGYRHPQPSGFPYLHPPGFSPLQPPGYRHPQPSGFPYLPGCAHHSQPPGFPYLQPPGCSHHNQPPGFPYLQSHGFPYPSGCSHLHPPGFPHPQPPGLHCYHPDYRMLLAHLAHYNCYMMQYSPCCAHHTPAYLNTGYPMFQQQAPATYLKTEPKPSEDTCGHETTTGENFEHTTTAEENFEHATIGENIEHTTTTENFEHATIGENIEHTTTTENFEHATIGENIEHTTTTENFECETIGDNFEHTTNENFEENIEDTTTTAGNFKHTTMTGEIFLDTMTTREKELAPQPCINDFSAGDQHATSWVPADIEEDPVDGNSETETEPQENCLPSSDKNCPSNTDALEEDDFEFDVQLETILFDGGKITFDKLSINGRPYLFLDEVCAKWPEMTKKEDISNCFFETFAKDDNPRLWNAFQPFIMKHNDSTEKLQLIPLELVPRLIASCETPEPAVIESFNTMESLFRIEDILQRWNILDLLSI